MTTIIATTDRAATADRAAHDTLARVSEWADGMPGADDAERLANIRRIVRTYERDVLGIVTAPVDQLGPAAG